MTKQPLIVSFSGGRTSAYMSYLLAHTPANTLLDKLRAEYEPYFVFANTGSEHEKTLEFIDKCDKAWGLNVVWLEAVINPKRGVGVRHKVVSFETASRQGEPLLSMSLKHPIPPGPSYRICTRVTKLDVIKSWVKSTFGLSTYMNAVGIRADEPRRIRGNPNIIYPLNDLGVTKQDVMDFFADNSFDLEIPEHLGNCVWCMQKTFPKIQAAYRDAPEYFRVPQLMEFMHPDKKMFRGHRKLIDVLNLPSNNLDKFIGECSESCEFISVMDEELDTEYYPENFL